MTIARTIALLFVVSSALATPAAHALEREQASQAMALAATPEFPCELTAVHQLSDVKAEVIEHKSAVAQFTVVSLCESGSISPNNTGSPMPFRAKCRITGVHSMNSLHKNSEGNTPIESVQVTLQPVYGTGEDDANKQWSKWTPSGELRLSITNPEIFPELVNGKTFYVDFTPAEA